MKLENQVTIKKTSQRLRELGVKQASIFYWDNKKNKLVYRSLEEPWTLEDISSAFTVAELGEMLPEKCTTIKLLDGKKWICAMKENTIHFTARNEVGARAKMLIYLLENKLI